MHERVFLAENRKLRIFLNDLITQDLLLKLVIYMWYFKTKKKYILLNHS